MNKRKLGKLGEEIASDFLIKNGVKIIERNYNTKYGEIDLIALENETIIFIEVKLRKNKKYGAIEETINWNKINKMRDAAEFYLQQFKEDRKCRFDIILIFLYNNYQYEINWIKGEIFD